MPNERGTDPSTNISGTDSFADLATGQAIRNLTNTEENELKDHQEQEETVPQDFEPFNLDAVEKLEESKKEDHE